MKKTGFVFSHAHWDIEWYMPYRSFRFWLVELMDRLIELCEGDPRFRTFVLDGQVAPVEHYVSVKPENEQKIRKLISAGKLSIGPFYTQFDEWLISAESIVRNCLYGNRMAMKYGEIMKAGYLPDNFGHPRQMPQILAEFGLDSLIFMRGMPDKPEEMKEEFYLEGLDGTKILCIHLKNGYGNAYNVWARQGVDPMTVRTAPYGQVYFGYEAQIERITDWNVNEVAAELIESARKLGDGYPSGIIPLASGCDHCPPQSQTADILERANQLQSEITFVQGNCEELTDAVKRNTEELPVYSNELWGAKYHYILTGTLSTRSYIKQSNFASENLLEKYAEPLAATAAVYGKDYPHTLVEEAWRFLFLNHAHDSIHGSSVDPVHTEMMQRYEAVTQIATGICHDALKFIGAHIYPWWKSHKAGILVYKPVPAEELGSAADVWAHMGEEEFHVEDREGNIIPMQILDSTSAPDPLPNPAICHILFSVPDSSPGLKEFSLVPGRVDCPALLGALDSIENHFLKVSFSDGELNIYDKETGIHYSGLNVIQDEADVGDAWDFSEPWEPQRVYGSSEFPSRSLLVENGPVRSTLLIETTMRIPARFEGDRRSDEMADLPVKTYVSLYAGSRRAEVSVEIDNQAEDHRLRLKCPVPVHTDTVKSQGHFGIIERPLRNPHTGEGWSQPPPQTFHFRDWVSADDGKNGLAVACKGLYEYEAVRDQDGYTALYITLMRSIGVMSRTDMKSRKGRASELIPVPGAQCKGVQRFEYAFIPYDCKSTDGKAPFIKAANSFLYPSVSHLIREKQSDVRIDLEEPVFSFDPGSLQMSAFKMAEEGDGYILRLWENEGRRTKGCISFAKRIKKVIRANMNEEEIKELPMKDQRIELDIDPFKVITLKIFK